MQLQNTVSLAHFKENAREIIDRLMVCGGPGLDF